jgi:cyclin B
MNFFNDNFNLILNQNTAFSFVLNQPKQLSLTHREFGRDITNLHRNIPLNNLQKTNKDTLYEMIKPTKREREELNRVKNQILNHKSKRLHSRTNSLCQQTQNLNLDDTPNYFNLYKNPQIVHEYIDDILETLLVSEKEKQVATYMKNQTDITEKMRAILVDWLIGVHMEFKLSHETLYLSVYMIDKYLESKVISRTKLQLLGITALFSASKYEEIFPPEINKFVNITDKAYTKSEILQMEKDLLDTLNFDVTVSSSLRFLEIIIQLSGIKYDEEIIYTCKYLLDLCLVEYEMIRYSPSIIAAAVISYVVKIKKAKTIDLERILGYTEGKLNDCIKSIIAIHKGIDTNDLRTAKIKYSSSKHQYVAKKR